MLEATTLAVGLRLNHSKCEAIGLTPGSLNAWTASGLTFSSGAFRMDNQLHIEGVDAALATRRDQLVDIVQRLWMR
jgi:hypothetical protein